MTMKKTTVNSKILTILICLLTLLPSAAKAQVGFDAVSIEAYIKDHKQQRSLLLVRSTLEASNKLLHDYSGDANIGFRDINKELDKYTRAFDVIDILYQSLRTSLNVYSTYENVSDKIGDYRKMLNDFRKKCLERGNIMSTDTLIITINTKALGKIADEGDNLYKSVIYCYMLLELPHVQRPTCFSSLRASTTRSTISTSISTRHTSKHGDISK